MWSEHILGIIYTYISVYQLNIIKCLFRTYYIPFILWMLVFKEIIHCNWENRHRHSKMLKATEAQIKQCPLRIKKKKKDFKRKLIHSLI